MSDIDPANHGHSSASRNPALLPTEAERLAEAVNERDRLRSESENAYKDRQIRATEAANDLARTNRNLTFAVVILTAFTAAATFYQGWVSRKSWETSQAMLRQMASDSQTSGDVFQAEIHRVDANLGKTGEQLLHMGNLVNATQKVAIAANGELDATRKQFRTDQRAWLEPEAVTSERINNPNWPGGDVYALSLYFKNFGKTPAINIALRSNNRSFNASKGELRKDLILNDFLLPARLNEKHLPSVIGPGNHTFTGQGYELVQMPFNISGQTMETAYVGRLEYDDVFGHHHWYTYCYIAVTSQRFDPCEYGNEEDETEK